MSKIEKDLGASSAYAYAVQYGGYTGTEEEYGQEMADLVNISAEAETLAPDEEASASYSGGVLSFGIPQGVTGNGIASAVLNSDFTLTLTFTDGTTYTTPTPIRGETGAKGDTGETGATGATGNGIASIAKTATVGLVDTYTITFTDGTTTTFDVTNGAEAIDATLSIAGRAADAKVTGDAVNDLKEDFSVNGLLYEISYEDLNGYISNRGVITTSGSWKHTEPIELKKLETISFTGTSVNSGIAMIALVNEDGGILNPLVFGIDTSIHTYEYTAVNDCFISVSHLARETGIKKGIKQNTLQDVYAKLKMYRGKNLIDANDTIDGYYIATNGAINSQESFCYTKHLIPCLPSTAYATTHNGTIFIVYYDVDMEYLSGTTANATTFITPSTARYMRISFAVEHKYDCMVCLATEKNRSYLPYVYGFSVTNIPNAYNMNHVYVGADKDFQTITSALDAINDATKFNRYTIHVSKGTYQETFSTKDYVDIEGEDKYKTIIDYTNADDSDFASKSTIFATSFSTLKNLTITTKGTKYPVHCDGAYGVPYHVIIDNCILKHNGFTTLPTQAGTAIGIGLYEDQHIEIIDSECIGSGVFGCASIYCHNANGAEARSGYRSIKVMHTTLSNSTYGFRLEAIEDNQYQDNDAWLIGIINNGETQIRNTHVTKDSWHLHQYS